MDTSVTASDLERAACRSAQRAAGIRLNDAARLLRLREERFCGSWAILSALFVLGSFDDAASVHEKIGSFISAAIDAKGFLYFSWIIPGSIIFVLLSPTFHRFVFSQPMRIRVLKILAATFYCSGTIGFEMLESAVFVENAAVKTTLYRFFTTAEETLEMMGVLLFATATLMAVEQSEDPSTAG